MDDATDVDRRWRGRLGRLRLGVEPLGEQLARYRRATWALTAIPAAIGAMFVALFWAFGDPRVGLAVAGVLLGPVVLFAWLGYWRLARRVARYERERSGSTGGRATDAPRPIPRQQ